MFGLVGCLTPVIMVSYMEKTLVLLKPDAVQRGIMGEILTRFEKAGLKVVGMKMVAPDEAHYHHHYETISKLASRRGEEVFKRNADFMMSGPVVAIAIEGVDAVSVVRKMVGETEPKSAAPGTIRGDYAHMTYGHANEKNSGLPNLIHASGDVKEAKEEIIHWFSDQELFDYKTAHQYLTN
ncbi:MAG: ndk2 [Candidatus Saccharibacteria bacterium]|nr:ndk2 [Candidatus Saccharibacteria bacterium]